MFFYCVFGIFLALPKMVWIAVLTVALLTLVTVEFVISPTGNAAINVYTRPLLLEFLFGVWIGALWIKRHSLIPFWTSVTLIFVGIFLLVNSELSFFEPISSGMGAAFILIGVLHPQIAHHHSKL